MAPSLPTLAELDARFARSRRLAQERRRRGSRLRRPKRLRLVGALTVLAVLAAGVSAGATGRDAARPAAKNGKAVRVALGSPAAVMPAGCPVPKRFRRAFARASRDTGVPLSLLVAVAYEESRMNPRAQSSAGALGLLQLMPATARELRLDPHSPASNVLAGARYLERMLDRFDGDLALALSGYNAGPAAVERAGGAPRGAVLTYAANVQARAIRLGACDAA